MHDNPDDEDFDWVTAKKNCTAISAFKALKDAVQSDVETRIGQDLRLAQRFEFKNDKLDSFSVRKNGSHMVVFDREGETIKATRVHQAGEERELVTVSVGMNDKGQCILNWGKQELSSWQFRRKALEETLFGD